MTTRSFDAFVSAVTSECGKARDAVAAELRKQGLRISVQSDFEHRPASVTTLRKLHDYIRDCDEVHCIIGTRSGECPPPEAAAEFAHLLPTGITEASYTQWEYFFAVHYVPDRLWLYIATDAYQPDRPAPSGSDRPELQRHFVEHLCHVRGHDYTPFANIGEVRAAVLEHLAGRRSVYDNSGSEGEFAGEAGNSEPFHRNVAANAIGGTIAGVLVAVLLWVGTRWGEDVNPALAALALLASGGGGVAFFVIYQRYSTILTGRGPSARAAYDRLRQNLAAGGLAAATYAQRLTAALDAVDRFFGDADMADRTLFPRAFGLSTPAPLWTAPAFDRCLLLALLYPIATVLIVWAVSGHVGPAEHALLLHPGVPGWGRASVLLALAIVAYCSRRGDLAPRWRDLAWYTASAVALAVGAAVALVAGDFAIAQTMFVVYILGYAGVGAIFGTAGRGFNGAGAVAYAVVIAVAATGGSAFAAGAGAVAVAAAVAGSVAIVVVVAVAYLSRRATQGGWQGPFLAVLVAFLTLTSLAASAMQAQSLLWTIGGPLLLFLGLLTLLNAPFDWAALGLTRALLRRGLELGGWFPYLLAAVDAAAAAVVIALLTVVSVLGVQAFDTLAAFSGGEQAHVLPLGPLFDGIASNPTAPEFWWAYAMLLSTMIPSLVNLTIGGASLLRGIPWVTALVLRNMPDRHAPPAFERAWMTLLLTSQMFLGGLLGIAAQGFLVYVVIGLVLPWFGLDLLDLARAVAAPDLPEILLTRLAGVPPS